MREKCNILNMLKLLIESSIKLKVRWSRASVETYMASVYIQHLTELFVMVLAKLVVRGHSHQL
jgi:hypothetical protein